MPEPPQVANSRAAAVLEAVSQGPGVCAAGQFGQAPAAPFLRPISFKAAESPFKPARDAAGLLPPLNGPAVHIELAGQLRPPSSGVVDSRSPAVEFRRVHRVGFGARH